MIQYVHSAAVIVDDVDAALTFYTDVLGFEKRTDQPMGDEMRFTSVAPRGAQTEIVLGLRNMYGDDARSIRGGITLIVEDVDATHADLAGRGVTFTMAPDAMPWGARGANFEDPWGNEFFLTTP